MGLKGGEVMEALVLEVESEAIRYDLMSEDESMDLILKLNTRTDYCWAKLVKWQVWDRENPDFMENPVDFPENFKADDCDYCLKCQSIREEWDRMLEAGSIGYPL